MASLTLSFFSLPPEIRDQIYSYIYNTQDYIAKRLILSSYRLYKLRRTPANEELKVISTWLFNPVCQTSNRLRLEYLIHILRRETVHLHAGPAAIHSTLLTLHDSTPLIPPSLRSISLLWPHVPKPHAERAYTLDTDVPQLFSFLRAHCSALASLALPTFYYAETVARWHWANKYWSYVAVAATELLCDGATPLKTVAVVVRPFDLWAVLEPGLEGWAQQSPAREGTADWSGFIDALLLQRDTRELGTALRDYAPKALHQASFRWRREPSTQVDGGTDIVWTVSKPGGTVRGEQQQPQMEGEELSEMDGEGLQGEMRSQAAVERSARARKRAMRRRRELWPRKGNRGEWIHGVSDE